MADKNEDQAFDEAFNEAIGENGSKAKESDAPQPAPAAEATPTGGDKADDKAKADEKNKGEAAEPTVAENRESETATPKKEDADKPIDAKGVEVDDLAWVDGDPVKAKHKHKTLRGMYDSEIKRRRELEAKLEQYEKAKSSPPEADKKAADTPAKEDKPAISADDLIADIWNDPEIKAFADEYGDGVAPAVKKIAGKLAQKNQATLEKAIREIASLILPVVETHEKTGKESYAAKLKEAHSDYEKYVENGEIESWIKSLPAYKQRAYMDVYDRGENVSEAIDLIHEFKRAMGYSGNGNGNGGAKEEPTPAPAPVDKTKTDGLEAVATRKSPISPAGKARGQSFDDAFNED